MCFNFSYDSLAASNIHKETNLVLVKFFFLWENRTNLYRDKTILFCSLFKHTANINPFEYSKPECVRNARFLQFHGLSFSQGESLTRSPTACTQTRVCLGWMYVCSISEQE